MIKNIQIKILDRIFLYLFWNIYMEYCGTYNDKGIKRLNLFLYPLKRYYAFLKGNPFTREEKRAYFDYTEKTSDKGNSTIDLICYILMVWSIYYGITYLLSHHAIYTFVDMYNTYAKALEPLAR